MFTNWTDSELLNAIWIITECNSCARGGYPLEWYLKEAIKRGIGDQLYHTDKTAQDYLNRL